MAKIVRSPSQMLAAARQSWLGLKNVWSNELAFREYCVYASLLLVLAPFVAETTMELALLIFSVLLVLLVEMVNSAIERVVDRIGSETHELSGAAKDIGSAAVVLSIIMCVLTWALLLFD